MILDIIQKIVKNNAPLFFYLSSKRQRRNVTPKKFKCAKILSSPDPSKSKREGVVLAQKSGSEKSSRVFCVRKDVF